MNYWLKSYPWLSYCFLVNPLATLFPSYQPVRWCTVVWILMQDSTRTPLSANEMNPLFIPLTSHKCLLSGWMEHIFYDFPYIGNFIIPTDEFIFFRGVGTPPTLRGFTMVNRPNVSMVGSTQVCSLLVRLPSGGRLQRRFQRTWLLQEARQMEPENGWNHLSCPYAPCMVYLPIFGRLLWQMLVNIPYMEHMAWGLTWFMQSVAYICLGFDMVRDIYIFLSHQLWGSHMRSHV